MRLHRDRQSDSVGSWVEPRWSAAPLNRSSAGPVGTKEILCSTADELIDSPAFDGQLSGGDEDLFRVYVAGR
jgi:hypothetical protein